MFFDVGVSRGKKRERYRRFKANVSVYNLKKSKLFTRDKEIRFVDTDIFSREILQIHRACGFVTFDNAFSFSSAKSEAAGCGKRDVNLFGARRALPLFARKKGTPEHSFAA